MGVLGPVLYSLTQKEQKLQTNQRLGVDFSVSAKDLPVKALLTISSVFYDLVRSENSNT